MHLEFDNHLHSGFGRIPLVNFLLFSKHLVMDCIPLVILCMKLFNSGTASQILTTQRARRATNARTIEPTLAIGASNKGSLCILR